MTDFFLRFLDLLWTPENAIYSVLTLDIVGLWIFTDLPFFTAEKSVDLRL
jgi:hypothetical protein